MCTSAGEKKKSTLPQSAGLAFRMYINTQTFHQKQRGAGTPLHRKEGRRRNTIVGSSSSRVGF